MDIDRVGAELDGGRVAGEGFIIPADFGKCEAGVEVEIS